MKSPAIHRTAEYRARAAYRGMLKRCGNSDGRNPSYTSVKLTFSLDEWLRWSVPKYGTFIALHPDKSPSVSRLNDSGNYSFSNIAIESMADNRAKQRYTKTLYKQTCAVCGKMFEVRKVQKTCSRVCGNKMISISLRKTNNSTAE